MLNDIVEKLVQAIGSVNTTLTLAAFISVVLLVSMYTIGVKSLPSYLKVVVALIVTSALVGLLVVSRDLPSTLIEDKPLAHYGLSVKKIEASHHYLPSGDFRGEITFNVTNTSRNSVVDLLPGKAGFFGTDIKANHEFLLKRGKDRFYNISESIFSSSQVTDYIFNGKDLDLTYFFWFPKVKPGIKPGQSLSYSVIIKTQGTEKEAFTSEGAFAGISTPYVSDNLTNIVTPPDGYSLVLLDHVVRDQTGNIITSDADSKPELRSDNKLLSWEVSYPIPSVQYLMKIRLVRD